MKVNDGRQVMTKAHMAFCKVSLRAGLSIIMTLDLSQAGHRHNVFKFLLVEIILLSMKTYHQIATSTFVFIRICLSPLSHELLVLFVIMINYVKSC